MKGEIILHSNQGTIYTPYAFQTLSKEKGITKSMSRKGNCHDNVVIESFYSASKSKWFYSQEKQIIHDYIEYYNNDLSLFR